VRWGKGRGLYGDSIVPITEAWEAVRGWCTSGGTSAQNGINTGIVEDRRQRVGGVGSFTRVGAAFYREEGM
jgi:hypothetical protein